jgi:hypothetical protein
MNNQRGRTPAARFRWCGAKMPRENRVFRLLVAGAPVIPLTALMLTGCISQRAFDQLGAQQAHAENQQPKLRGRRPRIPQNRRIEMVLDNPRI